MAWFKFDQNNSGGSFDFDDKLTHRLFIEADTEEEAEAKAFEMGVYYNGCENGLDCPCCGDRWYGCEELKAKDFEYSGTKTVEEYAEHLAKNYSWLKPDVRLFYKNGQVKEIL